MQCITSRFVKKEAILQQHTELVNLCIIEQAKDNGIDTGDDFVEDIVP